MTMARMSRAAASKRLTLLETARFLRWLERPTFYPLGALIMTALSAGTALLAPRLLDPAEFGAFALLSSIFVYAGKLDCGLSQLADRRLTLMQGRSEIAEASILQAQWFVGAAALLVSLPLAFALSVGNNALSISGIIFAVVAGILAMVSNGPVTVYRATSQVWKFTALALILHAGLTVPRLAGLLVGGVTGSFVALSIYYGACALVFARPALIMRPRIGEPILPMITSAAPLFAFNLAWIIYLSANRWICSFLSSPEELGLFSLGASLAGIGLGLLQTIAQVRYPGLVTRMNRLDRQGASSLLEREMWVLTAGLSLAPLAAMMIARPAVALLFPDYEEATGSLVAFAAACLPLGVMVWIMPIVIIRSRAPLLDAVLLVGSGLIVLMGAMALGDHLASFEGQAWGSAFAGLLTLALLLLLLQRRRLLCAAAAFRMAAGHAALLFVLAGAALWQSGQPLLAASADMPATGGILFEDRFDRLDLFRDGSGTWEPTYPNGNHTNDTNKELEYYVDPRPGTDAPAVQRLEPFSIDHGILAITARPVSKLLQGDTGGLAYASGLLTTYRRFSFLYGSAEIRAKMPKGHGLWPAFWLLPQDNSWPPEIDVLEVLGNDTRTLHITAHSGVNIPAGERSAHSGGQIRGVDLSADFHRYRVDWGPQTIRWYLDDQPIETVPTPPDMHKPMFLLINLAVGGWPGPPDRSTRFPAQLLVDLVRVRRLPDQAEGQ